MALPHPPPQPNFHNPAQPPYHIQQAQVVPQHLNPAQQAQQQAYQQYTARPPMGVNNLPMPQQQTLQTQQVQLRRQQQMAQAQAQAQVQQQTQGNQQQTQPRVVPPSPHHPVPSPHMAQQYPPGSSVHYSPHPLQAQMAGVPPGTTVAQMSPRSRAISGVQQGANMSHTKSMGGGRWAAGPSQPQPAPPGQSQNPQPSQLQRSSHIPHSTPTPQPQPPPQMQPQHPGPASNHNQPIHVPAQGLSGHVMGPPQQMDHDYAMQVGGMAMAQAMSRSASGVGAGSQSGMQPQRWDSETALKLYIHDYLVKHNYEGAAAQFSAEAGLRETAVPLNVRESVLYQWWSLFLEVFSAGKGVQAVTNPNFYNELMSRLRQVGQQFALQPATYIGPSNPQGQPQQPGSITPQQIAVLRQQAQASGLSPQQVNQYIQQHISQHQFQHQHAVMMQHQQSQQSQQRFGQPGTTGESSAPGGRSISQHNQPSQAQQMMYQPQPQQHLGLQPPAVVRTVTHSPTNPSPHTLQQPHPTVIPSPSPVQQSMRPPPSGAIVNGQMRMPIGSQHRPGQQASQGQGQFPQASQGPQSGPSSASGLGLPHQGPHMQMHSHSQQIQHQQPQSQHMTPQQQTMTQNGPSIPRSQQQSMAEMQAAQAKAIAQQQQQLQVQQHAQAQAQAQQQREQAMQIQQQHIQNASNQMYEPLGLGPVNPALMSYSVQTLGLAGKDVRSLGEEERQRLIHTYKHTLQEHTKRMMSTQGQQAQQQAQEIQQQLQMQQGQTQQQSQGQGQGPGGPGPQPFQQHQHQQYMMQQMYPQQQGHPGTRPNGLNRNPSFELLRSSSQEDQNSVVQPDNSQQGLLIGHQPTPTPVSANAPKPSSPERKRKRKNSEPPGQSPFGMMPGSGWQGSQGTTPATPSFNAGSDPARSNVSGSIPPHHVSASPHIPQKRDRRNQAGEMLPPRTTSTPKPSHNTLANAAESKDNKVGKTPGRTPKMAKEELQREVPTPKSLNHSPNGNVAAITDANPQSTSTHGFTPSPPSATNSTPANGVLALSSTPANNQMTLTSDPNINSMDFGMNLGSMGLVGMGMEFAMGMGLGALGGINEGGNAVDDSGELTTNDQSGNVGDGSGGDLDLGAIASDFDFNFYLAGMDDGEDNGNSGERDDGEVKT
ncbi:hypothetical protein L204_104718 [Cryptococcus depauperatus]